MIASGLKMFTQLPLRTVFMNHHDTSVMIKTNPHAAAPAVIDTVANVWKADGHPRPIDPYQGVQVVLLPEK
jgi:hypothetical protein